MRLSRSGILSVLLHAVALYGLMRAGWHTPRPAKRQATIVWLAIPEAEPPSSTTEDRPSAAEPTAEPRDGAHAERAEVRARSVPASRAPPAEPTTAPPASAPAPNSAPAPDLAEARRRATAAVLEDAKRADAHRSFAFPGTIAQQRAFDESERLRRREQGLQPPLTVFDSPAKERAKLPEERMLVYGVHWVSDDCYVFHEPLDRFFLPPGLFIEPTTCTRRLARTDLFLTAKPAYLMGDDERAAVDAEKQRRELLRRPTTGAVMPLLKD
jgi:hypothetical protein